MQKPFNISLARMAMTSYMTLPQTCQQTYLWPLPIVGGTPGAPLKLEKPPPPPPGNSGAGAAAAADRGMLPKLLAAAGGGRNDAAPLPVVMPRPLRHQML